MQFLYDEASPILKMAIDKALLNDKELLTEINALKRTKNQLDYLKSKPLIPSKKVIDTIMEYAKQTAQKKKSV